MSRALACRSASVAPAALLLLLAACDRAPATPPGQPAEPAAADGTAPAARAPAAKEAARSPRASQQDAPGGAYSHNTYSYDCQEMQVVVEPGNGELRLYLPDRSVLLPQVAEASGARYAEADVGFWGKGINTAILTLGDEDVECRLNRRRTPWEAARMRGIEFRAIGQEPGWLLEIGPDEVVVHSDYGQSRLAAPMAGPGPDPAAANWSFADAARGLQVELRRELCVDAMSGEEFAWAAQVVLEGKTLSGCGRILE